MNTDILKKFYDLGTCLIPVKDNKKPYINWRQYEKNRPEWNDIQKWNNEFNNPDFAVICGKVSKNISNSRL